MDLLSVANVSVARSVWISLLVLTLVWIVEYLGGFSFSPDDLGPNLNDTASLFNWHPFLMIMAFPVLMTEALFTYTAAPLCSLKRFWKKVIHASLQVTVAVLMVLSLTAVFRSHTEKKPKAIDNLYSPHSYLGITTLVLFAFQFVGGVISFVFPIMNADMKKVYAQYHQFFGMAVYLTALATILVGIQEKSTFNRHTSHHIHFKGSFKPLDLIPAVMEPLIVILAISVAFHTTFLKAPVTISSEEGPSQDTQALLVKSESSDVET